MGPSILFDKSAIQSLGQQSLSEINRYFYTTIPPVLLMEILGDLSLDPNNLEASRAKVRELAHKVIPTDAISTVHYHSLCVHNLLGDHVPTGRRPVVGSARPIEAKDGTKGIFIDVQPEEEAVLRWQSGQFNESDLEFAIHWRKKAKGSNLEALKRGFSKPPTKITSLEEVSSFVDFIMADAEFQEQMLHLLLEIFECDKPTCERIGLRWQVANRRPLKAFAPFAVHCLRVQLLFYIGMTVGLLSTRASNIVDLEYLHYTPFAFIFCSGDKLHRQLAPFVLQEDQTFVDGQEMQESLKALTAARKGAVDLEPCEGSLIWKLWQKHWGKPPRRAIGRLISEEESKRLMEQVKPIIESLEKETQVRPPGLRFPA